MIYGTLTHIDDYKGLHPRIVKGLELIRDTDFSKLPDGRYEVEGSDLFYNLQNYETVPGKLTLEAHRKYVDIQFVISGRERFGYTALENLKEPLESHPENDIWFYKGVFDTVVTLSGNRFIVVWPGDAHAPGIAADDTGPIPCRKCTVKVRL